MSKLYNLYKLGKATLSKKKKTLTVDKGALRISEINKKLKRTPRKYQQTIAEDYAQEVADIYAGKWKGKK
jgi:hypothetical protein